MNRTEHAVVERRGELLAELFLQDLNPKFVVRATPSDLGYDFLVGFPNSQGGINNTAVEVKLTEKPVRHHFPFPRSQYYVLAHSNIPTMILVIDVKRNKIFYAFPSIDITKNSPENSSIMIPVTEIDDKTKEELRDRLTG